MAKSLPIELKANNRLLIIWRSLSDAGFIERFVEFYASAQKVLVSAYYFPIALIRGIDCLYTRLGSSAFYLYVVLKNISNKNQVE